MGVGRYEPQRRRSPSGAVSPVPHGRADRRHLPASRPAAPYIGRGQLFERDQHDGWGSGLALRLMTPVGSAPVGDVDEGIQRLRETCHDIRQPVAAVLALAAAALADPGLPGDTRSYLEQIIKQAQSLAEVIRQRLDM